MKNRCARPLPAFMRCLLACAVSPLLMTSGALAQTGTPPNQTGTSSPPAGASPDQSKPPLNDATLQGAAPYGNPIVDDRLYGHVVFNQLEGRIDDQAYLRWEGQAWFGNDYNKLWFKSEGRYNAEGEHKVSDGEHHVLYTRPISTFFDLQAGLRYDVDSRPSRAWAALGIQGLAVGFWNIEATAYASGDNRFALKTNAFYNYYVTQRLILQAQFETNWYTKTEQARGVGSGLADIDSGLRLRYEISRKFAPYVGISYQRFFGTTGDLRAAGGLPRNDTRAVVGVRVWY